MEGIGGNMKIYFRLLYTTSESDAGVRVATTNETWFGGCFGHIMVSSLRSSYGARQL